MPLPVKFAAAPLPRIVRPEPAMVPADQLSVPVMVTSPLPASVPAENVRLPGDPIVLAAATVNVPPLRARDCVPLLPPTVTVLTLVSALIVTV